ncbi:MAG: hypothetical protein AABW46_03515 [Nanoarchaeota archaeon]
MYNGKRGALELSITTIVVVVIGITLLTLGLSFVYNYFQDLEEQRKQIVGFSDEKIREIFSESDDFINVPTSLLKLEIGEEVDYETIIKNVRVGATANDIYKLEWIVVKEGGNIIAPAGSQELQILSWFSPQKYEAVSLGVAESEELRFFIKPTSSTATIGRYMLRLKLTLSGQTDPIDSQTVTIQITG